MRRGYIIPGRIELVGKHVDYAGGRSLTCAVGAALHVRAETLATPVIRAHSSLESEAVEVRLGAAPPRLGWGSYVAAVARRLARDFPQWQTGVELWIESDLPSSAGLSSSSALVVAVATALADANRAEADAAWCASIPTDLARAEYFAAIETGAAFRDFSGDEGVGVRGGAQDPIAIICGAEGALSQFRYRPGALERRVPWPTDYRLVIGVSGVHATKTGNARHQYNRASDAMRGLVTHWNAATGRSDDTVAQALATGPAAGVRLSEVAGTFAGEPGSAVDANYMVRRLAQFREETEVIVPSVAQAFEDRDFATIGRLVDRSQELAEQVLGNQLPETIALARLAREQGAVAASAFGAGFGGAVWAMVPAVAPDAFVREWRQSYLSVFPERAEDAKWLVTVPSGPARAIVPEP